MRHYGAFASAYSNWAISAIWHAAFHPGWLILYWIASQHMKSIGSFFEKKPGLLRYTLKQRIDLMVGGLVRAIQQSFRHMEPNLMAVGLVGVIGFPGYYVVWTDAFPQPYESFVLRMIGCFLCLPFVLAKLLPACARKWLPAYWALALTYALPFFFTYMLLMNDASAVWGMSSMAAIMLLFLTIDNWVLIDVMYLLGSLLAWCLFAWKRGSFTLPGGYLEQMPVYGFAFVAGSIFSHKLELLKQERLGAMVAISNNVAHELRTPLLGIRSGMVGLRKFLPKLLQAYRTAENSGLDIPKIRASYFSTMEVVLDKIESEISFSNSIIDMLLINADGDKIKKMGFASHSMASCIKQAIERYPFQSQEEFHKVRLIVEQDFAFLGSDLLYVHVIFNLLKNALYSIRAAGKGSITITVKPIQEGGCVVFRDTGSGIASADLPYIFNRFFSAAQPGRGTGIGLYFCRLVMQSFGGSIRADAAPGEFAEFIMTFKRRDNDGH